MFGGNSNWRGPVWFPLNYLVIAALERYHRFFGDDYTVEYPTRFGAELPLDAIARDLWDRLIAIFLVGADGRRPCFGWVDRLQHDPRWKDNIVFSEYFHGDNGAGLGASHQTGWTGLVADIIRRRHGEVTSLGDLLRALRDGKDVPMTRALPGSMFPLGATPVDGWRELRRRLRSGRRAPVPVRRRRHRDPGRAHRVRRRGVARLRRGRRPRPGLRLPDDRAVRARPRACATTPPSCCSTPTPWRSTGRSGSDPEVLGYDIADPDRPSTLDSAAHVPRSIVVDPAFGWSDHRPRHAYADTVLYEIHVKGFTAAHPDVPEALRGTYAGLAHEAALAHLTALGVTTVELLPVHHSVPEAFLPARGLTNYWGYNTIGYFAPHAGYSAAARAGRPAGQVGEFQAMVDALHGAGLEVVLDVVFNHTAESDHLGPTLCHRGIDNTAYYRLDPADPGRYLDTTGCGNSLNAADPFALQMIMDSLRFWLTEMRVDGFRFDLAPTLAREQGGFDRLAAFFDLVSQDPVVSQAKLIAEPWDVGQSDSYDIGRFPPLWREWNGRYRDTMRDFWRSHDGPARRVRHPLRRLVGPVREPGQASHRVGQPDHRARRVHPGRPGLLRHASTTRRTGRATGTAPTTTGPGTAAPRAPPTTRPCAPCGPANSAPCSPR